MQTTSKNSQRYYTTKRVIHYLHKPIMQSVLGGSLHKNNTSSLLLGLYHASVNRISIVLMQITPQNRSHYGIVQVVNKRFIIQHAKLLCPWGRTLRIFIYGGMRDRSMQSGTKLAREIQLTDWSTAGNLSNRSSGVQIPHDICTRFGRYLYSTKCSWIINTYIYW